MKPATPEGRTDTQRHALLGLVLAASLALGWILLPFYGAILWAAIIALLFAPLYRWLLPRMGRRRTPAALATLLLVLLSVVLPLALVSASLVREAAMLVQRLQSGELNPALYFHGVFDALFFNCFRLCPCDTYALFNSFTTSRKRRGDSLVDNLSISPLWLLMIF